MTEVQIVTAAAEKMRAAFYPLWQSRLLEFPTSLRDEVHALAFPRAIQSRELAVMQMAQWLTKGYALFKAASLGIQPAKTRHQMKGVGESRAVIEPDDLCQAVQRGFREAIVPAAKELIASGVVIPGLSKDVRDYLGK